MNVIYAEKIISHNHLNKSKINVIFIGYLSIKRAYSMHAHISNKVFYVISIKINIYFKKKYKNNKI